MSTFRQVAEGFYVAPQLETGDFAQAAALGIRTVINNRPDGETQDQLSDADARDAALAQGLGYVHVPVVSGGIFPDHIARMKAAIDGHEGPFLAYCRSGTRSCHLWALINAPLTAPTQLIEAAAHAGYDLRALQPLLDEINRHNQEETAPRQ